MSVRERRVSAPVQASDALQRRQARYIPLIDWSDANSEASLDASGSGPETGVQAERLVAANSGGVRDQPAVAATRGARFRANIQRSSQSLSRRTETMRRTEGNASAEALQFAATAAAGRDVLEHPRVGLQHDKGERSCCLLCLHPAAKGQQVNVP